MFRIATLTEAGGHPENEDALRVVPHPGDGSVLLVALADGQGGRSGGAAAARCACEAVLECASRRTGAELLRPDHWAAILRHADAAVARHPDAGFTTLVGFCATDRAVCGASCGDSAVGVFGRRPGLRSLTERQRKNPPVGSGFAEPVAFGEPLSPGGRVIAVTDGVWKYVGWPAIGSLAEGLRGEELLASLVTQARLPRTGELRDDFTAVFIEHEPSTPATPR